MLAREFVDAVRAYAIDAATIDVATLLENPPGRRPSAELRQLSEWYRRLSEDERAMVLHAFSMVARAAVFGVFAILDGSRRVDPRAPTNDYFELRHVRDGEEQILSGPKGSVLHELL